MSPCRPAISLFAAATLLAAGSWVMAQPVSAPEALSRPAVNDAPVALPAVTVSTANQSSTATTALAPATAHPSWVDAPVEPTGKGTIDRIVFGYRDVVVIEGGLYQGLRVGTPCVVLRQNSPIAELVVVSSETDKSAALVTLQGSESVPGSDQRKEITLLPGDQVVVDFHPAQ